METARLLSTVLTAAAGCGAAIPGDASPRAVAAAVDQLMQQGLLQDGASAHLQLTGDGQRLLERIRRCKGSAAPDPVWCWDGRDFAQSG
ncbi:hypothetical protein [Stenotrophomonas sp. B1-1]|uniref:hypothetical protein n=1 Tax=Stenotrophomonas sp. B1-1 TaxID=2710648 RepID=UPI0013D8F60B|nr:hypothetical protein [Stenotrophomonas sp. B1-1]